MSLPSGLVILLKNCYFVPAMSRNLISVSCLDMDGFSFIIQNNVISIHCEGIFYVNGLLSNGLYILDLEDYTRSVRSNREAEGQSWEG